MQKSRGRQRSCKEKGHSTGCTREKSLNICDGIFVMLLNGIHFSISEDEGRQAGYEDRHAIQLFDSQNCRRVATVTTGYSSVEYGTKSFLVGCDA